MTTSEDISARAYRHWKRHGMTEWPTVRDVARRLRIRQSAVEECEGDGRYSLTGYNHDEVTLGDLYVEADNADVERDYCAYWLPYSHQCICGNHEQVAVTHTEYRWQKKAKRTP